MNWAWNCNHRNICKWFQIILSHF